MFRVVLLDKPDKRCRQFFISRVFRFTYIMQKIT